MKRYPTNAIGRARYLRQEMTLPEKMLWKGLRKPDLGLRRQVPIGRYIVDFAHLRARLVIELDGGWRDFPEKQLHDAERNAWLKAQGCRVVRYRNQRVLDDLGAVVEAIRTLLPQGDKGRDEGLRTEVSGREREAPPALFHQPPALTLAQPSPLEGEGAPYPDTSAGQP